MGARHRIVSFAVTSICVVLGGCALDVELTSSPDTVTIGEQVKLTVKVTNVSACPIGPASFSVFPLLNATEEEALDLTVSGMTLLTIDQLCSGTIGVLAKQAAEAGPDAVANARQQLAAAMAGATAQGAPNAATTCTPMTTMSGVDFLECTVDPLAPGAMETVEIEVPADETGTLRNVAFSFANPGFCDGGMNETMPCESIQDCPGANCDGGMCQGGTAPGRGCDEDADCPGTGATCLDCDRCQIEGICVAGDNLEDPCFSDDDCDVTRGEGACFCGASPYSCTTTTVITQPQGGECDSTAQCDPGLFCADGRCCDTECTGDFESCNLPGSEGTCTALTTPAPLLSRAGWVAVVALLLGLGGARMLSASRVGRR